MTNEAKAACVAKAKELELQVKPRIARVAPGEQLVLPWKQCFTCEAEAAVLRRAPEERMQARRAAQKLSGMPELAAQSAIDLGVVRSPMQGVPLAREKPAAGLQACKAARFAGMAVHVTIWPRSMRADVTAEEEASIHATQFGAKVSQTPLLALSYARAVHAAGKGAVFDAAMYAFASDAACHDLRRVADAAAEQRQQVLRTWCRSGDVDFLAFNHFGGLRDASAAAVDAGALATEEAGGRYSDGESSSSDDDDDEDEDEDGSSSGGGRPGTLSAAAAAAGNRSAAGRSGRWWDWSGLLRNPTASMAVSKSARHADHTLVVAPTTGGLDKMLISYTSRERCRAKATARDDDETAGGVKLPGDEHPSLPRAFMEVPGRPFLHVSHTRHLRMHQASSSSSAQCGRAVAASRVRALLFLAWIGLVPPPPSEGEVARASCCTDARARRALVREREQRLGVRKPDRGAAKTARSTWAAFALAPSRQEALSCLACLKGFYLNYYAAPLHKDSDTNMESWTLRRLAPVAPASEGRETPNAGATVLPLRGLAIHTRPDWDIVHAFFQQEEHGAWDDGAGVGRGVVDGHETAFHLQSGGASYKRLLAVRKALAYES
jgi:hypothetical protein